MAGEKQKVIVYIDGFNLYFGLKASKWKRFYWLDMVKFAENLLKPHQELVCVKYFSARSTDPTQSNRQDKLFQANQLNSRFQLHLGKYLQKQITCYHCKQQIKSFEEKETDVRIAITMLADVMQNECDITILISADSDLVPPIQKIRELKPSHKIFVWFPPKRSSTNLKNLCNGNKSLDAFQRIFEESVFPEIVERPDGFEFRRPSNWK